MSEQDFCFKLVQTVEKYPCLYNYNLSDYSRKDVVEKIWAKVGLEVNEEGDKCKRKWRNIRTVFMRHLKMGPSGGKRKKTYYLNDIMAFIKPYVKTTTADDHDTEIEDVAIGNDDTNINIDYGLSRVESVKQEPDTITVDSGNCSYMKRKQDLSEAEKTFIDFCNRQSNEEKVDDPKRAFLVSLLPDLQSLNDQEMRHFKRRVLALIDEIIESRSTFALS